MPPLGTEVVDETARDAVEAWITSLGDSVPVADGGVE
jgi:hypothetical protein